MTSLDSGSGGSRWPRTFGQELAILLLIAAGVTVFFMFVVNPLIGWPTVAPMPARSIILALAIIWIVRQRGESLSAFGLARPQRIWLAVVLGIVFVAINLFALQPLKDLLGDAVNAPPADLSTLEHIHGNLAAYLVWLVAAWVAAAFSEEFIFRGYLLNRIAAIGNGTVLAWGLAILVQAVVFGLGHLYAGPGVALKVGIGALFSGVFFLIAGRNLWALILAHGIWDTAGVTLIYLTGTPST
jgi:membrane protease YdiL (CAAX protease family)